MKSNLLYRGQDSALRLRLDGVRRGPGDRAKPSRSASGCAPSGTATRVTRWYFVADGRVGVDFSLLDRDDRPLTRRSWPSRSDATRSPTGRPSTAPPSTRGCSASGGSGTSSCSP